jgi:hypothetical protein
MMVNDADKLAAGVLVLTLETRNGEIIARSEEKFSIPALGAETYLLDLQIPTRGGDFLLKATAHGKPEPTVSRRKVSVAVE